MTEHQLKHLIKTNIDNIPPKNLQKVYDFIQSIIERNDQKQKVVQMKGIWKGLGFEKIIDLEGNLREIRKKSSKQVLEKFQ